MAKKSAKVNKTLEKAKKLVSKKGKSKTTKRSYPEGQNAPQSKAYNMENDKLQSAKSAGWRFTKEGAKKLNKKPTDKPTTSEIEKYRNQTFKVKGKVNKSGPSGSGDGSFRYLYIERRADKSDISKARKLELGGYNPDEMLKLKIYVEVYEDDYEQGEGKNVNSYKVDWLKDPQVKASDLVKYLSEELYLSENPNDYTIDGDGKIHTDQLQDADGIHVNDEATLERWKKGEEKLYNAHYYISVQAVKDRIPSVEELSQATGIGTYAKGGEMAKGGLVLDPKEVREFEKYVFKFYGKNGIFEDALKGGPATTGEVLKAVSQYITFCTKNPQNYWGGGDSMDREIVLDIMSYNRNPISRDFHYENIIRDIEKTTILEYGGILQPMIGGVNADPRFDIYNTTMFAEKGAEVPEGDEYAKGGETKIYEVAFVKKGKPAQYAASIRAKSEEEAVKEFKKQNSSLPYADMFEVVGVYKTTRRRLEDGGEMAKGGKITMADLKKRKIKKINQLIQDYAYEGESIQLYEPFKINVNDSDYLVTDVMEDAIAVTDSEGYSGGMPLKELTFFQLKKLTSQIMDNIGEMAKGGSTYEQGYDDREDERLAMRHGKIASKDFVGSHKRREHSRRDDARFETRNK